MAAQKCKKKKKKKRKKNVAGCIKGFLIIC